MPVLECLRRSRWRFEERPRGHHTDHQQRWPFLGRTNQRGTSRRRYLSEHAGLCSCRRLHHPHDCERRANWVARTVPQPVTQLGGVSCPSKNVCVAVGGAISGEADSVDFATTPNGGRTWKAELAAYGTGADFSNVSCPSTKECFAAGGDILATKNAGTTWVDQTANLPAVFLAVSCPSTTECFAVGTSSAASDVIYTTENGRSWEQRLSIARTGPVALNGVSCPSVKDCIAVGGSVIVATKNAGATWEKFSRR